MSFQTVEQLQATVAEQALEIKRLTGCLAKANANHEHFEREWYLSGDQIASLTAEIELLREALEHWVFLYGWKAEGMNIEQAKIHAGAFMMTAALQPKEGNP